MVFDLLHDFNNALGYGMTIGFPTIIIPAIQGGDARDASKGEFVLTAEQISWLSKC